MTTPIPTVATDSGVEWLVDAIAEVRADPDHVDRLFPVVARRYGRGVLPDGHRLEDTARVQLLRALPLTGVALLDVLWRLYREGDTAERRAVLLALPDLDDTGRAVPISLDALRTNHPELITAAMGDHATRHLSDHDYRQGVLKAVFLGIPLAHIPGLPERADDELAAMLRRYAAERRAADRPVPTDIEEWS